MFDRVDRMMDVNPWTIRPSAGFQIRTVRSLPPLASFGEQFVDETGSVGVGGK
jgi:hypothetical protein